MARLKVTMEGERPQDHPRWRDFQLWAEAEELDLSEDQEWWEEWFHCFVNGIRVGSSCGVSEVR
jgi:hypothetical protein